MNKSFPLFIFAGLLFFLSPHERNVTAKIKTKANEDFSVIIADFEKQLNSEVSKDSTGSFSAVIFKGGEIIWSKAFGKSNNQKNILADTNTVYRIGSISKTITAYLMLLLVQKGTIQLDEPVARYLPEIDQLKTDGKNTGAAITFRQLASHTSGLDREPADMANAPLGLTADWEKMLLEFIPKTGFHHTPGQQYLYSNFGYGVLGLAISRAAKKSFIDLVNEMVFQPHGMKSSYYSIPEGGESKLASGYHWYPSSETYSTEFSDKQLTGRSYLVPPGGVFCTANDLARFAMALTADADVLAKNFRDTMQTIQTVVRKNSEGYGLGLVIKSDNKDGIRIGHEGQVAGYNAFMLIHPDTRIGVILFRNCDNSAATLERKGNILLMRLVKAVKK